MCLRERESGNFSQGRRKLFLPAGRKKVLSFICQTEVEDDEQIAKKINEKLKDESKRKKLNEKKKKRHGKNKIRFAEFQLLLKWPPTCTGIINLLLHQKRLKMLLPENRICFRPKANQKIK